MMNEHTHTHTHTHTRIEQWIKTLSNGYPSGGFSRDLAALARSLTKACCFVARDSRAAGC